MRYIKYDIGQVKACTEPPLFMCDKNVEKLIK